MNGVRLNAERCTYVVGIFVLGLSQEVVRRILGNDWMFFTIVIAYLFGIRVIGRAFARMAKPTESIRSH